ncbi:MAG: T9SS type A sorting domain-containing protein [Chitinophagaceae bacterium]|nr:T9SS type A sorting domain-containing protein [Chitinophagaceae bacterium]
MQKKRILKMILLVFISCSSAAVFAQQAINVSSHSAVIEGAVFDYSIGEMTRISTEHTAGLIVTQGILQPYATSPGGNAPQQNPGLNGNSDLIKVYPNPTENLLFIESVEPADATISYNLYDATGKLILNDEVLWKAGPNKFSLHLQTLAAGSYYLLIRKSTATAPAENFSFKIQKTN